MIHRPRGREKKPVLCVNTGVTYPSVKEAAAALNISHSGISISIIRDIAIKGYRFNSVN